MMNQQKTQDPRSVLWLRPNDRNKQPLNAKPKYKREELTLEDFDLGIKEAAQMMKVSVRTIANYRRENRIASLQVSSIKYLYSSKDIKHYLSLGYRPALYMEDTLNDL
ncbi:MAG: helix-turn-helix domain-containing protein [Spirochaetota bacterium]